MRRAAGEEGRTPESSSVGRLGNRVGAKGGVFVGES